MSDEENDIFDFFESEEEDQPTANGGTGQAKSGTTLQNKGELANGHAQSGTNSLQQLSGTKNSQLQAADDAAQLQHKDAPSADQAALALNNATTSDERAAMLDANQAQNAPATRDKTSRVNRKLEHYSVPEIYKYDFEANPKPWNENGKQDMDKYFNYGFTEETWRYHAKEMLQRAPLNDELSKSKDLQKRATNHFFFKSQFNFVLPHQFGGFADPDAARTYTVQVPVQKPPQPEPTEPVVAVEGGEATAAVAEETKEPTQVQQPGSPTITEQLNMTNQDKELSTESMEQVEIEIPSLAHVNLYNDNVDLPQIKPRTVNNRNEFFVKIPYEQGFEISKEEARRAIGRTVLAEYEVKTLTPLRQQLREKQEILKKKQNQLYDLKRSMDGHGRRGYMGRDNYNNQGYNNSYYGSNKSEGRGGRGGGHRESAGKYHRESAGKYGGRDQDMSSYDSGAQYHNDRHRDDDNMSYGGSRQGRSERAGGRDYHHHDSRSSSMRGNNQRAKSRSPSSSHGGKDGRSKSGKDHHHDRRRSRSRDRSPRSRSPRDKKQQQSGKDGKSGSERRDFDNEKRKTGTSAQVQSLSSTRRRNDSRESDKKTDHHRSRQKSEDHKSGGDKSRHQRTNRSHSSEKDKGKRAGPRDDTRGGDQTTGKSGSDARQKLANEPASTKSGADQAQSKSKDDRRGGRQKSPPASKPKANDNKDRSNTNNRRRDQSPEDRSRNQSKKGTNDYKSGNQSRRRNSRSPETGASGNKSAKGGQQSKVTKKPDNNRQQQSQSQKKQQGTNSNNGNSGTKPLQIERKGSMSGGSNQTPNKGGQANAIGHNQENRKGGANKDDSQQQNKQGNGRNNRNNRRNQSNAANNDHQRKGSESPKNNQRGAAKDQVKKHVVIQGKKSGAEPLYIKKRK